MDASFNHTILIKSFLRLVQLFKASFNGKTNELPFNYPCKPNKSSYVKESDRLIGFPTLQHFKFVFEKFFLSHINVLLGIGYFCDMGKKKLHQFPIVFRAYLLGKE